MASVHLGEARSANFATFKLLFLIIVFALVTAIESIELGQNIPSDLNDKSSIRERQTSQTSSQLQASSTRGLFATKEELNKANESQQAAQIIEFRSSDNQIPAANPNFEAAFQGECSKDRRRANLCDHICLDLYDGTFECACFYGFALAVDGYSCTQHLAPNTPELSSRTRLPSSPSESSRVAALEATTNKLDEETTPSPITAITESPAYEVITQENGGSRRLTDLDPPTKWTSRAIVVGMAELPASEPPSLISSSTSFSSSGKRRLPAPANGSRRALRKLASEQARKAEEEVHPGRVGGGGGGGGEGGAARHGRRQSGPVSDLASQTEELPLGDGELNLQDDRDAMPSDNKRQRARQASERRDASGSGRRARASAAERTNWKHPHQRQDSQLFDPDYANKRIKLDANGDEQREVAQTNNEQRRSFAASDLRAKDDLQGNWIWQAPISTWAGQKQQDEDNLVEQQQQWQQLARTGDGETWPWTGAVARSPNDGSSKMSASKASVSKGAGEREHEDERSRWSFDGSAALTDANSSGVQDSTQGLEGGHRLKEEESEIEEEEEEQQRQHQALERDLGLLENLIGKTMADYRGPHWSPKSWAN